MTDTLDFERTSPSPGDCGLDFPASPATGQRRLDRVEVHADPTNALPAWAELEAIAPGSVYQTRRWLLPWIATAGRSASVEPMLAIAYSEGQPVVFCPFGMSRRGSLRVAGFLGGKDSNVNLALFRPGCKYARAELISLFTIAAAKAAQRPDLFILSNQPSLWEGIANPLVESFPHQPSPSDCHRTDLVPQFDVFLKNHLSKDTRKKLRQKEKWLSTMGTVAHLRARSPDEIERILDAFVAQKRERLTEMGIAALDVAAMRAFLQAAAHGGAEQSEAAVEFHALAVGDRIVATFAGGEHRGRFHGMVNSFDLDPLIARSSPGDLLLSRIVEEKCLLGLKSFDLGVGEGRYKDTWCDTSEPLFDTILPITIKGHLFALTESLRLKTKRAIKQNDWAWAIARKLRARRS